MGGGFDRLMLVGVPVGCRIGFDRLVPAGMRRLSVVGPRVWVFFVSEVGASHSGFRIAGETVIRVG